MPNLKVAAQCGATFKIEVIYEKQLKRLGEQVNQLIVTCDLILQLCHVVVNIESDKSEFPSMFTCSCVKSIKLFFFTISAVSLALVDQNAFAPKVLQKLW